MSLNYDQVSDLAEKILGNSHSQNARIRKEFFEKEYSFFRDHLRGQKVLVAGSGLGHEAIELAKQNKEVIGVEILGRLVKKSNEIAKEMGIKNLKFIEGDFLKLDFPEGYFDNAILNMGTIGSFDNRFSVIKSLLKVSKKVFFDFYPPKEKYLPKRKRMHEEEGWTNVVIDGDKLISDDGLESVSISNEEVEEIVKNLGAKVKFYDFHEFSTMAEVTNSKTSP